MLQESLNGMLSRCMYLMAALISRDLLPIHVTLCKKKLSVVVIVVGPCNITVV